MNSRAKHLLWRAGDELRAVIHLVRQADDETDRHIWNVWLRRIFDLLALAGDMMGDLAKAMERTDAERQREREDNGTGNASGG